MKAGGMGGKITDTVRALMKGQLGVISYGI